MQIHCIKELYHMRKSCNLFCAFIILIITMFLSTGCGKEVPVNDNNDNISSSKVNEEKHPNSENIGSSVSVNTRYFKSAFSENKSFSGVNHDNFFITSLIVEENQLLYEDNFSKETSDSFNKKMSERVDIHQDISENSMIYPISAAEYYSETSTGYTNLTNNDILFITTAEYNPVLSIVTYTDYDSSDKEPKEYWVESFKQELQNQHGKEINFPIVIRESWSFYYNGFHIEIVNANNIIYNINKTALIYKNDIKETSFIPNDPIAYKMSLIFIDGMLSDTSQHFDSFNLIKDLNQDDFSFPENYETAISGYATYQYDKNGNVKLYPLYLLYDYDVEEFSHWLSFLFADIDMDGKGELTYWLDYGPKFYGHETIIGYELTKDCKLQKELFCPMIY